MKRIRRSGKVRARGAFTLLELVVVIAILAVIGGAALVAYDGLGRRASNSQAAFSLAQIDKGIRLSKILTGGYPNELDCVVLTGTELESGAQESTSAITATAGGFYSRLTAELQGTDGNKLSGDGLLSVMPATANMVAALNNVGITAFRTLAHTGDTAAIQVANRGFDLSTTGAATTTVATGTMLPIIVAKNLGASDSSAVEDMTGLPAATTHLVVCLGLGNNSSVIEGGDSGSVIFPEAPIHSDAANDEYSRYFLLFHLGSDTGADDTISEPEVFSEARFIGVIDSMGSTIDQNYADSNG